MKVAYPPGPAGLPLIGSATKVANPEKLLGFLEENAHTYGDITHFTALGMQFYLINHPDYIQQVLVTDAEKYYKDRLTKRVGKKFLGNGLFFIEGDFHKKQRKLVQPAFHHNRIKRYVTHIGTIANDWLDMFENEQPVSMHHKMMEVTLAVVCEALFNTDAMDGEARHVVERAMGYFHEVIGVEARSIVPIPDSLPIPRKRRMKRSIHDLQQAVRQIIARHRATAKDDGSLISMFLLTTDENGQPAMSDQQVVDESLSVFMAAHETSALAMTWACYLLARHPEVQQRLRDEVQAVLGERQPTMEDIPNLQYTLMVIKEAMRLYPPGWILGREPIEPTKIGSYDIPVGSIIFITPYVVHRDGRFFDEPDCFRPERFDASREKEIPRYAYIPFGGGPRVCVGAGFAMMEMQIVLAAIAQRFWMDYPSGEEVEVASGVTLHPAKPIYITFRSTRSTLR